MAIDRDFRTDTTTVPLPEMIETMSTATWGDSVFSEDETTVALENKVAELAGKQAGLFCVSGTLSNQLGIRTSLRDPPYSVLCDDRAHVYRSEASGIATLSQAMVYPVIAENGCYITLEEIKKRATLIDDIHVSPTRLISLENTLSGTIMPLDEVRRISEWARANGIHMHLDGARLWNVTAATGTTLEEWCRYFDSVSLCLSKGLCAPVGSVLVGTKDFIHRAKWFRKQQGGGIRQSGWLASAALVGIEKVWPTMAKTHKQAKYLADQLKERYNITTALPVQTSMVVLKSSEIDLVKLREEAAKRDVLVWATRFVLHYWTSDEAIEDLIEAIGASKAPDNDAVLASVVY